MRTHTCTQIHTDTHKYTHTHAHTHMHTSAGVDLGAIKHLPSNRDMVAQVSKTLRSFSSQRLSTMAQPPMQVCHMSHLN